MKTMKTNGVGPVLIQGLRSKAFLLAIERANKGVTFIENAAYVRVLAMDVCQLKRAEVELILGHAIRWPEDLEAIMPSFKGTFTIDEKEAVWA